MTTRSTVLRTVRRGVAWLVVTVLFSGVLLGVTAGTASAAVPGCFGQNWQFAVAGQDIRNGNSTTAMDSCNAKAFSQRLRLEADELQTCVTIAGFAGTVFSFFLSRGTVPQVGAVVGLTFAGGCTQAQTEKRVAAGRISEKVDACGELGIKFRMFQVDGFPRVIKDFVCQGQTLPPYQEETAPPEGDYIPISYQPTASEINYPTGDPDLVFFPEQVTSPRADEGSACSTAPHYFSDVRPEAGVAKFWVHETISGSRDQFEYNPNTGQYDIYVDTPQLNCPDPLPPSPTEPGSSGCPLGPEAAAAPGPDPDPAGAVVCTLPDDGRRYQVVTRLESASHPERGGGLGTLTTWGIPEGASLSVERERSGCADNFAYPRDCPSSFYAVRDKIMATGSGGVRPLATIGYYADGWPPSIVNTFSYDSWWVEPVP